jgi:hypothetical protein
VNEMLYRALLNAQLSGEDVATRLQVDPKTVRCWLDGRVPYLRHRWALARLVGMDQADLWPQLRPAGSRPGEVMTIYPHRDSVPREDWLSLFSAVRREAGILADSEFLLAIGSRLPGLLAAAGVRARICIADPAVPELREAGCERRAARPSAAAVRAVFAPADVRVHGASAYHTICYADDDLMIAQHVYGLPEGQAPVLRLRRSADGDMASSYLDAFERTWADARSLD